jgi:glycosyltransferase involved in cell wall biosynthesis
MDARDAPQLSPSISVIIPVYTAQGTIAACLDALGRNDYSHVELLVIDDASTDDSVEIASLRLAKTACAQQRIARVLRDKLPGGDCLAGEKIAVMYPDGTVTACELLEHTLGHLHEHDLDMQRLWREPARFAITRRIRETFCRCTHECFFTANLLFHRSGLAAICRQVLGPRDLR